MTPEHGPAPWTFMLRPYPLDILVRDLDLNLVAAVPVGKSVPPHRALANARLVRAAPEMAALLWRAARVPAAGLPSLQREIAALMTDTGSVPPAGPPRLPHEGQHQ
jgi:hypothetical protein